MAVAGVGGSAQCAAAVSAAGNCIRISVVVCTAGAHLSNLSLYEVRTLLQMALPSDQNSAILCRGSAIKAACLGLNRSDE